MCPATLQLGLQSPTQGQQVLQRFSGMLTAALDTCKDSSQNALEAVAPEPHTSADESLHADRVDVQQST